MIRHSMDYVQRAEKVFAQLPKGSRARFKLWSAQKLLVRAESELVRAYGVWRDGIELAAAEGNELAARYLKGSEWDLT